MFRTALIVPVLMAAAPAVAQQAIETKPIVFQKGMSSATVKGTLKGQTIDYTLNARAGQTLNVRLQTSSGATYFNLIKPSEENVAFFIGSTEGKSFTGPIPESGNTKIRVYQMRSAARRGEVAPYTLTVSVTGKGTDTAAASPVDVKVPGTNFHATGLIKCSAGGAPMRDCTFGVAREDRNNGNGYIEVTLPDGRKRVIFYEMNTPVRYDESQADGGKRMTVSGGAPNGIYDVRIGDERYQLFDSIMTGG